MRFAGPVSRGAAPPGYGLFGVIFRWLAPPANLRRPSGTKRRRRAASAVLPGRMRGDILGENALTNQTAPAYGGGNASTASAQRSHSVGCAAIRADRRTMPPATLATRVFRRAQRGRRAALGVGRAFGDLQVAEDEELLQLRVQLPPAIRACAGSATCSVTSASSALPMSFSCRAASTACEITARSASSSSICTPMPGVDLTARRARGTVPDARSCRCPA